MSRKCITNNLLHFVIYIKILLKFYFLNKSLRKQRQNEKSIKVELI